MNILKNIFKNRERKRIIELKRVAMLIGEYYLGKNKMADMTKIYYMARKDIMDLGITKLEIKNKTLFITLSRPGLLIGQLGNNFESLQNFIVTYSDKITKIDIIEDMIINDLMPYEYSNDEDGVW